MNAIGEFKCPECGLIHMGISAADGAAMARKFEGIAVLLRSDETLKGYDFSDVPAQTFNNCFQCGSDTRKFVPAVRRARPSKDAMHPIAVVYPTLN